MSHKTNHTMHKPDTSALKLNRRQFLRGVSAGAALFYIAPRNALKAAQRVSANEKISVAGIGVGSRGVKSHANRSCAPHASPRNS